MALDVGSKTIGVAVTDELGWTAQGVKTIKRKEISKDIEEIISLIKEYSVGQIVVGIPLYGDDGEIGIQAKKMLLFAEGLKKVLSSALPDVAVETWDESMTTAEAHEVLSAGRVSNKKRKKVVDKLAAVFILESYLRGQS